MSSLVGAKGSDLMIMNLANAVLESADWPTKVEIGRFMFALGGNERNTAFAGGKNLSDPAFAQRSLD